MAAGDGDDVVITSQLIADSLLDGGDGFDILQLNSDTFEAGVQVRHFEVWNLADCDLIYQGPDESLQEGIPRQISDFNLSSSVFDASWADLDLSNTNLVGLEQGLQIVAVDYMKNKLGASAVTEGRASSSAGSQPQ